MQLVRDTPSHDLLEAVALINEAMKVRAISGIVFGCALKGGRRYFVNVAGSLAADPTMARGVVAAIEDELRSMVLRQSEDNTTIRGIL